MTTEDSRLAVEVLTNMAVLTNEFKGFRSDINKAWMIIMILLVAQLGVNTYKLGAIENAKEEMGITDGN